MANVKDEDPNKYLTTKNDWDQIERQKFLGDKKWVWIADEQEGFIEASITDEDKETYSVETSKGKSKVNKNDAQKMNPPKFEKCQDMALLGHLNEANVLHNLRQRYYSGLIYTYSGLFCVVVNPYRRLPIYTKAVVQMYKGKRRDECPPHIFSITDNAYQSMLQEHHDQSILITGESGAGKTENTKKVIQYFAAVAPTSKKSGTATEKGGNLEDQIVQANPILEAFGNAKTVRNDNSSRFGKFIRVHFDATGFIAGADIDHYLLEKSRVIHQSKGERNYHIFYQLMAGSAAFKDQLLLTRNCDDYKYLQESDKQVNGLDDSEGFKETMEAINIMEFSEEETLFLWKTTAAILHFGNVIANAERGEEQASMSDISAAEKVCHLIGIPVKEFVPALLKPRVRAGNEWVTLQQTCEQVNHATNALAKAMYDRIFKWLVARINKTLETRNRRQNFIGVLDISGFEIFKTNSFEQLCINHTNEKLQQFFNHHMFNLEQEEYRKEGIEWTFIDFGLDLQDTIDLIEKKMGLLELLDEACLFPKSTDASLLEKFREAHLNKSAKFGKPAFKSGGNQADFFVSHYAGVVDYSVAGFLDKNRDPLNDNVVELLKKSTDANIVKIWADRVTEGDAKRKKGAQFRFVAQVHKEGINNLMTTLINTTPHFVRCIIPNEEKKAGVIDAHLVLHQLRCNGVLEGIRICRQGFPSRILFQEFRQRYEILAPGVIPPGFMDGRIAASKLVAAMELEPTEFRIGRTKIFFRSGVLAMLEDQRDEKLSVIMAAFQARCRGYLDRYQYNRLCQRGVAIKVLQRNIRTYLGVRNWPWWRLYTKVKPLLNMARQEDEMRLKDEELERANERALHEEALRRELELQQAKLLQEKQVLYDELQVERADAVAADERAERLEAVKGSLEKQLQDLEKQLEDEEESNSKNLQLRKKLELELEELRNSLDLERKNLDKINSEKMSKETSLLSLEEQVARLTEALAKMTKEKKACEDRLSETSIKLQEQEDNVNSLTKKSAKLESSLADSEAALLAERNERAALDKARRQTENELKNTLDQVAELERTRAELESSVKKRDADLAAVSSSGEESNIKILQLQKEIAQLKQRIEELTQDLQTEQELRKKAERQASELSKNLNDIRTQLEEEGGAKNATLELSKKREAEVARLKQELEEATRRNEEEKTSLRTKHKMQVEELEDQVATLTALKSNSDRAKAELDGEVVDLSTQLEDANRLRAKYEKQAKQLEQQLAESKSKVDSLISGTAASEVAITKLRAENAELNAQVLSTESKLSSAEKARVAALANAESLASQADEDNRSKMDLVAKLKRSELEAQHLQEQLDEEEEAKATLEKQVAALQQELSSWKQRYDQDAVAKGEEAEAQRKKAQAEVVELQSLLEDTRKKLAVSDKNRKNMEAELEDLRHNVDQATVSAATLEKKQKKFDQLQNEWKRRLEDLEKERDDALAGSRALTAQLYTVKGELEAQREQLDLARKEKKHLENEVEDLTEQLGEGGKSKHEIDKAKRNLEIEAEDLRKQLAETEGELTLVEDAKVRLQLELNQLKVETERKLNEKESSGDEKTKALQRQLDLLKENNDNEVKARAELAKHKKRLEGQLSDLETGHDQALKQAAEAQKQLKKVQSLLKDAQQTADEEARAKETAKEALAKSEKRVADLEVEANRAIAALEASEKARKALDSQLNEQRDIVDDKQQQLTSALDTKRRLESEIRSLQEELEDEQSQAENAISATARLSEQIKALEVSLEQERTDRARIEKLKGVAEKQAAELAARVDEAESTARSGGKQKVTNLETKVKDLTNELDELHRTSAGAVKKSKDLEKKIKELQAHNDEEKKANEKLADELAKAKTAIKAGQDKLVEVDLNTITLNNKIRALTKDVEDEREACEQLHRDNEALKSSLRAARAAAAALDE